jgi:hypothetical protein
MRYSERSVGLFIPERYSLFSVDPPAAESVSAHSHEAPRYQFIVAF